MLRTATALCLLLLACVRAEIPPSNPWGAMDDEASVAYIAASAQSMLMASYNFTATFDSPGAIKAIDAGEMGSLTLLPGPPGLSISWALLEIGPCSMILPHTHPSGNEVEWTLAGEGLKAGLMPNGATKMETKDIPPGTLSVYPQGLNHLQFNTGCDQAKLFVTFDQPYPTGLITVPANVVGMPAWMAAASLNAYGGNVTVAQMEALQAETAKIASSPSGAGDLNFAKLPAEMCKKC